MTQGRANPDRAGSPPHGPARLPRIHLASQSPRRRELLAAHGIEHDASAPGLDDAQLSPGIASPEQWVMALAYLKASAALRALSPSGPLPSSPNPAPAPAPTPNLFPTPSPTPSPSSSPSPSPPLPSLILAADTIVLHKNAIIGQPKDAADARRILLSLRNATHDVLTGVALIDPVTHRRELFSDRASVTVGHIPDEEIDHYIASNQWRGKAGAYNLNERLAANWPITFQGDPGTIMGLPMRKLVERLLRFPSSS